MERVAQALRAHGLNEADVGRLLGFAGVDGYWPISESEFEAMQAFCLETPELSALTPVLTDRNSKYSCVYHAGALTGMVCFLDHEETSVEPRFRNLTRLVDVLERDPQSLHTAFDFPRRVGAPWLEEDRATVAALRQILQSTDDEAVHTQLAFCLLALTPPEDLKEIYPFLDDADMHVQERAIEVIGHHRYEPARAKLVELTRSAQWNGRMAAQRALERLGTL